MKYVSPYFSKGQKIEYDSKRRSYTPEGTPLEMGIDTYNIGDILRREEKE